MSIKDVVRRLRDGAARRAHSPVMLAQRQILAVRGLRRVPSLAQWRELPRYLSSNERRIFAVAVLGAILAVVFLGYRLVIAQSTVVPRVGGTYTEGLVGTPQFINPLYAIASDTDSDLTRLVFSGLLRWDPVDGVVPDIAERYEVSEDQKTYTFHLRSNIFWHDGNPVTTQDVVFTIQALQNPEYHSPLAGSFTGVVANAIDDATVTLTLPEPFAFFPVTLTVGLLPAHIWETIAPSSAPLARYNLKPVGSGPYRFAKSTRDQNGNLRSMTLERYEDFYRGAPYIRELTFTFAVDSTELTDKVRNKNVEGAGFLTPADAVDLDKNRSLTLYTPALSEVVAVSMNTKHSAPLADSTVRTALAQATDREALIADVLFGTGMPLTSVILPSMTGYDASVGATTFDVAAANAALETAGWKIPEGSVVRQKDSTILQFTITTVDTPELVAVAEALKNGWGSIGASVTIRAVDATTLQSTVLRERDFDLLLSGQLYGADGDLYPFWHSSQASFPGLNVAQFANRDLDNAIVAAREKSDAAATAKANADLARLVAESGTVIPLYQPSYPYLLASKIKNITLPTVTTPADRFSRVNEWYINVKHVFQKNDDSAPAD